MLFNVLDKNFASSLPLFSLFYERNLPVVFATIYLPMTLLVFFTPSLAMIGPILTHLQIKEAVFSIVWSMNFKFIDLIKKLTVINQNNKIIFRLTVQIVVTLPCANCLHSSPRSWFWLLAANTPRTTIIAKKGDVNFIVFSRHVFQISCALCTHWLTFANPFNQARIIQFLWMRTVSSVRDAPFFFPGLFLYVYIESPIPKKPRRLHTTGPKPHQLKTPTPETQYKTPTPKPQTAINEQK